MIANGGAGKLSHFSDVISDGHAELMRLTGHQTKRDAVEYALREAARRAKWRRVWSEGLGASPDALAADAAPKPADLIDAPDIDSAAVDRALASVTRRRARRAQLARGDFALNEPAGGESSPSAQP